MTNRTLAESVPQGLDSLVDTNDPVWEHIWTSALLQAMHRTAGASLGSAWRFEFAMELCVEVWRVRNDSSTASLSVPVLLSRLGTALRRTQGPDASAEQRDLSAFAEDDFDEGPSSLAKAALSTLAEGRRDLIWLSLSQGLGVSDLGHALAMEEALAQVQLDAAMRDFERNYRSLAHAYLPESDGLPDAREAFAQAMELEAEAPDAEATLSPTHKVDLQRRLLAERGSVHWLRAQRRRVRFGVGTAAAALAGCLLVFADYPLAVMERPVPEALVWLGLVFAVGSANLWLTLYPMSGPPIEERPLRFIILSGLIGPQFLYNAGGGAAEGPPSLMLGWIWIVAAWPLFIVLGMLPRQGRLASSRYFLPLVAAQMSFGTALAWMALGPLAVVSQLQFVLLPLLLGALVGLKIVLRKPR